MLAKYSTDILSSRENFLEFLGWTSQRSNNLKARTGSRIPDFPTIFLAWQKQKLIIYVSTVVLIIHLNLGDEFKRLPVKKVGTYDQKLEEKLLEFIRLD